MVTFYPGCASGAATAFFHHDRSLTLSEHDTMTNAERTTLSETDLRHARATVEYLTGANVVGNHASDCSLWMQLDAFAADDRNPIELRARVIRKVDEIIGDDLTEGMSDADVVAGWEAGMVEGLGADWREQILNK